MKKILLLIAVLMILSCSENPARDKEFSLSGKVTSVLAGSEDIIENNIVKIELFLIGNEYDEITAIKSNYDFLGADYDEKLFIEHRNSGIPYKSINTDSSGNFEFNDVAEGVYILVYSAEGFGWHKDIIKINEDTEVNLRMRKTRIISGQIDEDTSWAADSHILIDNDFFIRQGVTLEIGKNTVIEVDNSKIILFGNMNIVKDDHNPVIFTSCETNPDKGDWNGITNYSETGEIENCIIQWSSFGIKNENNLTANNIAVLNCSQYGVIFNYKSGIISNSFVGHCNEGLYGFWTKADESEMVADKSIFFDNKSGIDLYESSPSISDSYFINNGIHIRSQYNSYPSLASSVFDSSENYAVYSEKEYDYDGLILITECEFINNNIAVRCNRSADITAKNNNISADTYGFYLSYYYGVNNVSAQNNWWGTSDENEIQNLIYDESDEPGGDNSGEVDYSNWKSSEIKNIGPKR
ncbi:MAG: hypothetical protein CSB55_08655 [Candidatus Cloacimonadota bacterium]|nr:MAG: hypothetical protein CSB55_08655 [Candidatus Cloacimonadota bacterium]